MQAVIKSTLTEHRVLVLVCAVLITANIIHAYHTLHNDLSMFDASFARTISVILFMPTIACFFYTLLSNTCDDRYKVITFAVLFMWVILSVIVIDYTFTSISYFDECGILAKESQFVARNECIEYARNNPDATGAQIIDVLTEQNRKVPQIEELLDRPLNP